MLSLSFCLEKKPQTLQSIYVRVLLDAVRNSQRTAALMLLSYSWCLGVKEIDIAAALEHIRDQRPGVVRTKVRVHQCLSNWGVYPRFGCYHQGQVGVSVPLFQ